eukprot:374908-Rhodomonas_salina.2
MERRQQERRAADQVPSLSAYEHAMPCPLSAYEHAVPCPLSAYEHAMPCPLSASSMLCRVPYLPRLRACDVRICCYQEKRAEQAKAKVCFAISLRVCYAMCGNAIAHGSAVCGTEIAYGCALGYAATRLLFDVRY